MSHSSFNSPQPITDAAPLTVNGRYLIHEKIGEGGMGVVYRATDRLAEHILAFKQVIVPTWHYQVDDETEGEIAETLRLALALRYWTAGLPTTTGDSALHRLRLYYRQPGSLSPLSAADPAPLVVDWVPVLVAPPLVILLRGALRPIFGG